MNALNGRFGSLSLEQTRWFNAMACAYVMAPTDSWLRGEAERLLRRACLHYGVEFADAIATVNPALEAVAEDIPAVTA